jgi:hypothetical protein
MMPLEQDREPSQVAIPDGLHQAAVRCLVHIVNYWRGNKRLQLVSKAGIPDYQTRQAGSRTIGCPTLQANAFWNSGMF